MPRYLPNRLDASLKNDLLDLMLCLKQRFCKNFCQHLNSKVEMLFRQRKSNILEAYQKSLNRWMWKNVEIS